MTETTKMSIDQAVDKALDYFSAEDVGLGETERMRGFEAARIVLKEQPTAAVGLLAEVFSGLSHPHKIGAYRLIVELGQVAIPAIHGLLDGAGPLERIWLISILHALGDGSATTRLAELVGDDEPYIRQLTVLALVFQGKQATVERDRLIAVLAEALLSEEKVEGSAFFVADSALSCLRLLSGETFAEGIVPAVHFYNFDHFLFSPPIHPFPYTSDRVSTLPHRQKRQLQEQVREWWAAQRETFQLHPMTSCFEL